MTGRPDDSASSPDVPLDADVLAGLVEQLGRDDTVVIIDLFVGAAPDRAAALVAARDAADDAVGSEQAARTAHTLRSTAALLGAGRLVDAARALQRAAEAGPDESSPAGPDTGWRRGCDVVREELERVVAALREQRAVL